MKKGLIIVESPTKVRTIKKIVGKNFEVEASVGHIKDLPKSRLGVKIENGFEPEYVTIRGKKEVIKKLKAAAKKAKEIYLGPDPDREGEAIAWHIAEELKDLGKPIKRLLLYEITERGIKEALSHPTELDRHKFESQKARRILDRLVGYNLSPLLWEKVKRGLSAGRVQSVALRLICEREREREAFVPEEYWTIEVLLEGEKGSLLAKLKKYQGQPVKPRSAEEAHRIVEELKRLPFVISRVEKKKVKRNPAPPFITSTLQQEAWRKLRFSAKKTMMLAQRLYEGVELGEEGAVGLITYMRTDSFRVAEEAQKEARQFVSQTFGADFLPPKPPVYKSRKGAQEAHEAIRPTSLARSPESLKPYLSRDELRLYELIFRRFVASQMKEALFERTEVYIAAGEYELLASGLVLLHPGFLAVYRLEDEEEADSLPQVSAGEALRLSKIDPKQHFTQPPPRYTEASLIRTLEEKGIGRPSTYAQIVSTIKERGYVETEKGYLKPTELGLLVNDLLTRHFPDIIETGFTARLEEALDEIEEGRKDRVELLKNFYQTFSEVLQKAEKEMASLKAGVPAGIKCPSCGEEMIIRVGRAGAFLACSRYPECKETRDYVREKGVIKVVEKNQPTGEVCEKCGRPMVVKRSRYGEFLACSGYPECRNTKPISTGIPCPKDGCPGTLIKRKARTGKIYYRCSKAPECDFILWQEPITEECPECKAPFMIKKREKKEEIKVCPKCGHKEPF